MEEYKPNKSDLNNMVLDYLVYNGYVQSAEKFSKEANLPKNFKDMTLPQRMEIRASILSGNVEEAIEKINDNFPTILDLNPTLHFALLRLQLIEIVRNGDMSKREDIMAAINFAAQQLAPRASKDPKFVEDLNYGMCLVVFKDKLQPDVQKLLDKDLRAQIAGKVNDAILVDANESPENKLLSLLKARLWSELKCRETQKNIPEKIPLGLSRSQLGIGEGNGDVDLMVQ